MTDPKTGAQLPPGYDIGWAGEFDQMQQANRRLLVIVPVSITLILILLYTAFNSIKDALLVMANVVAATMGGVWALKLTGTAFSISAAVGFISIFGVAVQDGVLLISYFNQMRAAGLPVRESLLRGADLRVRPVVMTSLTAALGLFPAAIATSIGSQAQKPLAIVVVGGMLVTLFLTRYLMPVLYSFFPAPAGHGECESDLILGSHYTDRFLQPAARARLMAWAMTGRRDTLSRPSSADSEIKSDENQLEALFGHIAARWRRDWRYAQSLDPRHVVEVWKQLSQAVLRTARRVPLIDRGGNRRAMSKGPWNRILTLNADEIRAIGLKTDDREAANRADGAEAVWNHRL